MKRVPRTLLLLLWSVGVILPLRSFRAVSPTFRTAFDAVFRTPGSTVAMHALLYAVLGGLAFAALQRPTCRPARTVGRAFLLTVTVSLLQEGLQLRAKHIAPGADELLDTTINLSSGLLGILLAYARRTPRTPATPSQPAD